MGNGLLLYNNHIVIPSCLQKETLEKILEDHQGIEKWQEGQCGGWDNQNKLHNEYRIAKRGPECLFESLNS